MGTSVLREEFYLSATRDTMSCRSLSMTLYDHSVVNHLIDDKHDHLHNSYRQTSSSYQYSSSGHNEQKDTIVVTTQLSTKYNFASPVCMSLGILGSEMMEGKQPLARDKRQRPSFLWLSLLLLVSLSMGGWQQKLFLFSNQFATRQSYVRYQLNILNQNFRAL